MPPRTDDDERHFRDDAKRKLVRIPAPKKMAEALSHAHGP